jgi:WD40 repeat protein
MSSPRSGPWLALVLTLVAGAGVADKGRPEERKARTDRYGDPLPDGAVARLGTVRLRNFNGVTNLTFSPDSRLVASTIDPRCLCGSARLFLWERETGRLLLTLPAGPLPEQDLFFRYVFTGDSKGLISGDSSGKHLYFWNVVTGKELKRIKGPGTGMTALALSPDGKIVACGDDKGAIRLWDVGRGRLRSTFPADEAELVALAFTGNGKSLATLDEFNNVRLLGTEGGKILRSFKVKKAGRIVLAPDGRTVASFAWKDGLRLWTVATGEDRRLTAKDRDDWFELNFAPDGKTLLAVDKAKGTLHLWDVDTRAERRLHMRGIPSEQAMLLSPDGKTLAASEQHSFEKHALLSLWDAATGQRLLAYPGHTGSPHSLTFSPDGKILASANYADGMIRWDVSTTKPLSQARTPFEHSATCTPLEFAPDGMLGAQGKDNHIDLYDTRTGRRLHRLRGHTKQVTRVIFSPRGDLLASAGEDGLLRLWQVAGGRLVRAIDTHKRCKSLDWVAFTPDGATLATGDGPLRVHLWKTATGEHLAVLKGNQERWKNESFYWWWNSCFTPDGKILFCAYSTCLVVWDVSTRREAEPDDTDEPWRTISGPIALSPDGCLLAALMTSISHLVIPTL